MDRRSFINRDQLNSPGNCHLENCKCGETVLTKREEFAKIKPLRLAAIAMIAFVSATVFLIIKIEAAKASMEATIRLKKENALFCSLDGIRENLNNDQQSANRNSGNGCPHQLSASALLIISDYKRKKNHNC
jgi:hypothetical protein